MVDIATKWLSFPIEEEVFQSSIHEKLYFLNHLNLNILKQLQTCNF